MIRQKTKKTKSLTGCPEGRLPGNLLQRRLLEIQSRDTATSRVSRRTPGGRTEMSRTFAHHRLLTAPRIGLAGPALAAILTTGAVAGGKCQDEAPASPVTTAATVVAPVAVPAVLAPATT